jgi:glucose-1-phosphate thymidylyltransferase
MKGIILAGGEGSRLYPMTLVASKQLQAVFDKPMVYYPLTTLLEAGIRDIALISTAEDLPRFKKLFGDGSRLGASFTYFEQLRPEGIPQAFIIAEEFIGGESVALILGDNIFCGATGFTDAVSEFQDGAVNFGYYVQEPQRYGVIAFDANGEVIDFVEKPEKYISSYVLPGFYIYDASVVERTRGLKPSRRGELEITDLSRSYLKDNRLKVRLLPRGVAWLDAGTPSAMHDAAAYIQIIEKRQGIKIGCPEEAALDRAFVSPAQFEKIIAALPHGEYRAYLEAVQQRKLRSMN